MTKIITLASALAISTSAQAESPYPTPKPDGTQRGQRTGAPRTTATFASGDHCKAFH
ncbi:MULTISPECIES: hypothetical protein [unclassified Bradyrhizobium]|uniref:hypothetical protein n=1 Tax=unclassified Bradyrhizobium TaxID=2631580 RepID=UPI001CD2DA1A|nr:MULTISPECIES: hypothetical protein [unclassified Bradyrhizobium]MCA1376475.1 hypothetical protein [Bradyrhizobium sp. IC4060]MCA1484240.1 hypothetical protein [Bradyrhizobium sp. IC4061]MCA1539840.1 hypothetical protein [Bradyrhizobium sp. NBAIM32]